MTSVVNLVTSLVGVGNFSNEPRGVGNNTGDNVTNNEEDDDDGDGSNIHDVSLPEDFRTPEVCLRRLPPFLLSLLLLLLPIFLLLFLSLLFPSIITPFSMILFPFNA